VRLDSTLAWDARYRLIYRSIFGGDYALREGAVASRPISRQFDKGRSSFGRKRQDKTAKVLAQAGWQERWQGSDGRACERLLRPVYERGEAYDLVCLQWFEGAARLPPRVFMGWDFLRAAAPGRRRIGKLAENMKWSRRTAERVIRTLLERGLIEIDGRDADGVVFRACAWERQRQKPPTQVKRFRHQGTTASETFPPPGGRLLTSPSEKLTKKRHTSNGTGNPTSGSADAFASRRLLATATECDDGQYDSFEHDPADELAAMRPLSRLRMWRATGGKHHPIMTQPAGLWAIRWLAAQIAFATGTSPNAALAIVLAGIRARIRDRKGARLETLALIIPRIMDVVRGGDATALYAEPEPRKGSGGDWHQFPRPQSGVAA
jgi:hypothetical protein